MTDVARMSVDNVSDEVLLRWVDESDCLSFCGGISIMFADFIHLKEGRLSTAKGMTLEYAKELIMSMNAGVKLS